MLLVQQIQFTSIVKPLCEYIEIDDERWINAIEGYLNTRRFNLIVEPKYYDVVSKAYDRYKNERKVYVSGIVNVSSIPLMKENKKSIMSKIHIKDKNAYKYANYLLGDLICVENVSELKDYDSAITPSVMVYKNHVLKACNPEIYKKPFIGRDSLEKRISLLENEIKIIQDNQKELHSDLVIKDNILLNIESSNIKELLNSTNYWQQIEIKEELITSLNAEIKQDEKEQGLLEISGKIENAKKNLQFINEKISICNENKRKNNFEQGKTKQIVIETSNKLESEKQLFESAKSLINEKVYLEKFNKYFSNGWLNAEQIKSDRDSLIKSNSSVTNSLTIAMQSYSSKYKPSLIAVIENIQDYINEYYSLVNRGVVQYEMEAKEAYERAEFSFREDFISKLKEKIETSQRMLDKLNKNLSTHPFGSDEERYKFTYKPTDSAKNSEFFNYYRIIMSGKEMNSKDLFTEILDEKDYSFMKDLFDKISMETNSSEAEAELQRYLDYRNYMNYDILITNKYGDESYFSKINKEKSGGETQTPFYIVIASCFDELMNKDSNKIDSTCQVVFDEAFNNMDESRIQSLMEFYEKLNIQIIIVVPSNRMSSIAPYMETMIGITKINNHPHITTINKIV